jgi:hypothetical protein
MPGRGFEIDVIDSIRVASLNSAALDTGLEELRVAVADRKWSAIEGIRERLLAAVDGYVDNYVAAGKRVEHERIEYGYR